METQVKCPYCGHHMCVESIYTNTEAEKSIDGSVPGVHMIHSTVLKCVSAGCSTEVKHDDYDYKKLD